MRKSKEEAAESRRRIIKVASRLYRQKGFDGVGVAEIMEAAGMTHGGFYRHFSSKEALIAEAMAEAFSEANAPLARSGEASGSGMIRDYIEIYLSNGHLERPDAGCPVAALGSEAAHLGGSVSQVFDESIEQFVSRVSPGLDGPHDTHRAQALRLFATLVGAVVIARAVGVRSAIRDEVLEAARQDAEINRLIGGGPASASSEQHGIAPSPARRSSAAQAPENKAET